MEQLIQLFIILFSIIGIESLVILFIFWKAPVMPFLKAGFLKRPIMYVVGKDKSGVFKTFKPKYGSAFIKNEGIYNLSENSHTLESRTKTPIYFAFRDFAATLKPEYAAVIQILREKGYKLTTIEDLNNLILEVKKGTKEDININVKPFTTIKLHDLDNMFPYNLDPTFIDAQVQGELNKFNKMMRTAPLAVMSIVVLMMVMGLTVFIVQKAFKGQISVEDCKAMIDTGKIAGAVMQSLNSSIPIVP